MPAKNSQALRRVFEDPFSVLRIFCSFFGKTVFIGTTLSNGAAFSPSAVVFVGLFLLFNATSLIWRQSLVFPVPGGAGTLQSHSPLRTVRDSFPSHGSSILKAILRGRPDCFTSYANIARNSRADNAGNNLLSLLFLRCQKYLENSGE